MSEPLFAFWSKKGQKRVHHCTWVFVDKIPFIEFETVIKILLPSDSKQGSFDCCIKPEKQKRFRLRYKTSAESLIRLGVESMETQQLAIFGVFLNAVPYMDPPVQQSALSQFNLKTYAELLGISEECRSVIRTQVAKYANLLNSWAQYEIRAKLVKGDYLLK